MTISFIVAASENNIIGNKGQLPWSLPDDLKYFKNTTWGLPVIMGRKTYESFAQVLKGRTNIVITRQPDYQLQNALLATNLSDAIALATTLQTEEIFIIGGGEIFTQALPIANKIYLTRVHTEVEGDAFFPKPDVQQWKLVSKKDHPADAKHAFSFSFEVWEKSTINQVLKGDD